MFQEREAAAKMFKGKKGKQFAAEIGKRNKTFVPGAGLPQVKAANGAVAAAPDSKTAQAVAAAAASRQQDAAAIRVRA